MANNRLRTRLRCRCKYEHFAGYNDFSIMNYLTQPNQIPTPRKKYIKMVMQSYRRWFEKMNGQKHTKKIKDEEIPCKHDRNEIRNLIEFKKRLIKEKNYER